MSWDSVGWSGVEHEGDGGWTPIGEEATRFASSSTASARELALRASRRRHLTGYGTRRRVVAARSLSPSTKTVVDDLA